MIGQNVKQHVYCNHFLKFNSSLRVIPGTHLVSYANPTCPNFTFSLSEKKQQNKMVPSELSCTGKTKDNTKAKYKFNEYYV